MPSTLKQIVAANSTDMEINEYLEKVIDTENLTFLGCLSYSGYLLLWFGVRPRVSCGNL